ncbi:MAG: GNAT family N-acetyltransferase [Anaerolineae bacterium]|nr:GNAT family N-acetyltransferase [Anaerolineae bacterium]
MSTSVVSITIANTTASHVWELEDLQRIVFPTLTSNELFTAEKYLNHLKLFPEGQFVAIATWGRRKQVVGATTTYRRNFDFEDYQHTFLEAIAHGWLTHHNPKGEWLYGVDISIHPEFRRLGIGSQLYDARRDLARRLNLRGEIAGGMIPGYEHYKHRMSIETYVAKVVAGEIQGKTLPMQVKNGFEVRGILYDHITDPRADNAATLLVRPNPYYRAEH